MYFGDKEGVTYSDDLFIAPDTNEEHNKMLEVVKCALKYEIQFQDYKMQHCKREVKYIGFKFNNKDV